MKTRITKLFGIKHPIILPGMSWISSPELVAAVCNAGGTGWLATGPLSAKQTREAINKIRKLTDKPFGCGATLLMPGARENAKVFLEEQVPIINVSLGKANWICEGAHKYGGKVIQTVTTIKHALAAEKSGVDALQVTGNEAAAHGSQIATMILVEGIREVTKLPIVAAGGIADGKGLVAALAMGADGVAMGTRLATTVESPVHETTKKAHLSATIEDTIYSDRFDGLFCRILDSKAARKSVKQGMNIFKAAIAGPRIAKDSGMSLIKVFAGLLAQPQNIMTLAHFSIAFDKIKAATEGGDLDYGVHLLGQCTGVIHDMPTVDEVVKRVIKEAKDTYNELGNVIK